MLELNDPAGFVVDDEFSVGEELIVAPILEKSSVVREGESYSLSYVIDYDQRIFFSFLYNICSVLAAWYLEGRN